jgi:cation diffusion facilitator family transporter
VIAAILLVSTKLTVGLWTNSLGILSEALHSGIDLIAAVMTLFAVRMGDRPPDLDHQYGHEKIESMSSLAETLLLFITCAWIVYEALQRLFFVSVEVDITYIAILVMVMSIVVDFTRSRALMKVAKKYKSQALEADAIHFSTDLLSSVVVLIGIMFTLAGFKSFDALAALGVAAITAVIGWRLWKRSVHTLLDGAPKDISEDITSAAETVPGVMKVGRVRMRESGHKVFVDALVYIDKAKPLEQAHKVTEDVTKKIEDLVPNADVMIHAEPLCPHTDDLVQMIREEAVSFPEIKTVHNIMVSEVESDVHVDLHLEMDGDLNLEKAHDVATRFEERILQLDPCVSFISSHIEPVGNNVSAAVTSAEDLQGLKQSIGEVAQADPRILCLREVVVRRTGGRVEVSLCCQLDSKMNVQQAHDVATDLENRIRTRHESVHNVNIHMEPYHSL